MGRVKGLVALVAVMGFLLMLPAPAKAILVTIDEIIFQDGGVNSSVLAGTADFTLSSSTLTIVLTNTSTGATGGGASTNLLGGIGFNLPGGVTISNTGATNAVALTGGSSAINFVAPISDTEWGAGNGALSAINSLTLLGDVNASASTLQAQINFDLAGNLKPTANVDGPSFGLLSSSVSDATAGGLEAVKDSVTLTLLLDGTVPGTLLSDIDGGHVVLSFGSPDTSRTSVPEPSSFFLMGFGLVSVGLAAGKKRFF